MRLSVAVIGTENRQFKSQSIIAIFVPVIGVTMVALSLFLLFNHHAIDSPDTGVTRPTAPQEGYLLRLSGAHDFATGPAARLIAAWLQAQGGQNITSTASSPTRDSDFIVAALVEGRRVEVRVRAAGDTAGFVDLAGSATDIAIANRPITDDERRHGDLLGQVATHAIGLPTGAETRADAARQRILLYTASQPSNPAVAAFIDFVLSGPGQRILRAAAAPVRRDAL